MQTLNISSDLLARILVELPKGTPIFDSFLKIASSVQNASIGLNGGYYYSGLGVYSNIDNDEHFTEEGLNGFFSSIGGFISRNVKSAVKDTVKVVKLAAPLLSMAASFLPGGSIISGIVNKVIGASDTVQTVDSVINQPQQQSVQEIAPMQVQQNVNQFGFPNTGTFVSTPVQRAQGNAIITPVVNQITEPQIKAFASLKNTDVETLKQEIADLKDKAEAKPEVKKGFEITTPIAIGGVGVLGLMVYLATKK